MTEEELLEYLRQADLGMISQSAVAPSMADLAASAAYDPSAKQAAMAQMLRGGQEALMAPGTQGRTVGNQYFAPNWGDMAADAAGKLMGGYQMRGARQGMEEIAGKQEEARRAAGSLAELKAQKEADAAALAQENLEAEIAREQERAGIEDARYEDETAYERSQDEEDKRRWRREYELKLKESEREFLELQHEMGIVDPEARDDPDKIRQLAIAKLPSSTERNKANLMAVAGETFADTIRQGNKLLETGTDYSRLAEFAGDAAKMFTPSFLEDAASNAAIQKAYTPEQLAFIGNLANAMADLRKSRTGANVTAIETELFKNFDPTVKGLTVDERIDRAIRMMEFVNTTLETQDIPGFGAPPARWTPEDYAPIEVGGKEPSEGTSALDEEIRRLEEELGI